MSGIKEFWSNDPEMGVFLRRLRPFTFFSFAELSKKKDEFSSTGLLSAKVLFICASLVNVLLFVSGGMSACGIVLKGFWLSSNFWLSIGYMEKAVRPNVTFKIVMHL
ncbi:hypothetical protein ACFFRR_001231 [Megaselia abdita]